MIVLGCSEHFIAFGNRKVYHRIPKFLPPNPTLNQHNALPTFTYCYSKISVSFSNLKRPSLVSFPLSRSSFGLYVAPTQWRRFGGRRKGVLITNLALDGGEWSGTRFGSFTAGACGMGNWWSPRTDLWRKKNVSLLGIELWYTDWPVMWERVVTP